LYVLKIHHAANIAIKKMGTDQGKQIHFLLFLTMQTALNDIQIRTVLKPGDVGSITQLHGWLYGKEYGYGVAFETYVAQGLYEFYKNYDAQKDAVWICEHKDRIIGFLLLMHRENKVAQLRYFILLPEYRGLGLGKKTIGSFYGVFKGEKLFLCLFVDHQ
jgi:peptidyl-dipeptidase Dcp